MSIAYGAVKWKYEIVYTWDINAVILKHKKYKDVNSVC